MAVYKVDTRAPYAWGLPAAALRRSAWGWLPAAISCVFWNNCKAAPGGTCPTRGFVL